MSAQPDDVAPEVVSATLHPDPGPNVQRDTGTPVSHARDYKAKVIPVTGYLGRAAKRATERAAKPAAREQDAPDFLSRPKTGTPWSEDCPSPRCRIADARDGAVTFGAIYWVADAIPLALNIVVKTTLQLATERPGRFWALFALVSTLVALILH